MGAVVIHCADWADFIGPLHASYLLVRVRICHGTHRGVSEATFGELDRTGSVFTAKLS